MQRAPAIALPVLLLIAACSKGYEAPLPQLPGVWQEAEAQGQSAGYTYRIKFSADSTFRLYRNIFTAGVDTVNACNNARTQWIQGTYHLAGDRLQLRGPYFDSSFAFEKADCGGATSFYVQHSIAGSGKNLVLDGEGPAFQRITLRRADSL